MFHPTPCTKSWSKGLGGPGGHRIEPPTCPCCRGGEGCPGLDLLNVRPGKALPVRRNHRRHQHVLVGADQGLEGPIRKHLVPMTAPKHPVVVSSPSWRRGPEEGGVGSRGLDEVTLVGGPAPRCPPRVPTTPRAAPRRGHGSVWERFVAAAPGGQTGL